MTIEIVRLGEGGEAGGRPKVAVVGCGGAGCNSLRYVNPRLGITTFAMGHDQNRLRKVNAIHRFVVSAPDMDAAVGTDPRIALSEHLHVASTLAESLRSMGMVFAVAGLGGDVGWRCAALASRVAGESGALSVIVGILPFSAESRERVGRAAEQFAFLRGACDGLLAIRNDKIMEVGPKLPFSRAMELVSELALLVPHELAAAAAAGDVRLLRAAFAGTRELRADVATASGADRDFKMARDVAGSEWMAIEVGDVASAVLLVSGADGDGEMESCAREVRDSFPDLKYLAFGRSASVPHGERAIRACAVLGLK